jgi:hypothetical protein
LAKDIKSGTFVKQQENSPRDRLGSMSSPRYKDGRVTTSASTGYNAHKFGSTQNNAKNKKMSTSWT